jgi:hypothetical protein
MRNELAAAGAAFGLVMVGNQVGVPEALGAHPFWAAKVAYIGAAIGLGLALAIWRLRARFTVKLALAAGLLALTAGSTAMGKARFAASYAEDAFAGKMWFFGWIGLVASFMLVVFVLLGLWPASRR